MFLAVDIRAHKCLIWIWKGIQFCGCASQDAPDLFQSLLHKTNGSRSDWEYPFAVAGVNLTFMMQELLDLRRKDGGVSLHTPANAPGIGFLHLLEDDAKAFDKVRLLLDTMYGNL